MGHGFWFPEGFTHIKRFSCFCCLVSSGKNFIIHLLFLPIRLFLFWFFLFNLGYCMVVFICSCGIRMKRKETRKGKRESALLVMTIPRIHSSDSSPMYWTAVLAIVTMLYTTSMGLIYLVTESLHLSTTFFHPCSPHLLPLVTTSLISFSMTPVCFFFLIPHATEIGQYLFFSVWFISLAQCLQGLSMCQKWLDFLIFMAK